MTSRTITVGKVKCSDYVLVLTKTFLDTFLLKPNIFAIKVCCRKLYSTLFVSEKVSVFTI